jgi:putative flippase GtrA
MKNIINLFMLNQLSTVIRHGLVSAICAIIDFSIFYTLFNFYNFSLNLAYIIAIFFSALVSFLAHTFFTFKVNKVLFKNLIYFIIQLLISFIIGISIFSFFVYLQILPEMSKIYQLFFTFWFNFLFGKFISFRKPIKNL